MTMSGPDPCNDWNLGKAVIKGRRGRKSRGRRRSSTMSEPGGWIHPQMELGRKVSSESRGRVGELTNPTFRNIGSNRKGEKCSTIFQRSERARNSG